MRSLTLYLFLALCLFTSCYQQESQTSDAWNLTEQQVDSISFYTTHHYTQNFNFFVKRDSIPLIVQHHSTASASTPSMWARATAS